jgi:CDGSH-type Zn-finger protein
MPATAIRKSGEADWARSGIPDARDVLIGGRLAAYLRRCGGPSKRPHRDGARRRAGFKALEAYLNVFE